MSSKSATGDAVMEHIDEADDLDEAMLQWRHVITDASPKDARVAPRRLATGNP